MLEESVEAEICKEFLGILGNTLDRSSQTTVGSTGKYFGRSG